jgi:hypothetical protein
VILLFLHGLPGVGKLTVAREIEARTGYPVFHNHLTVDLVTAVFEFGTPEFRELREHIWLDVLGRAASAGIPGLVFTFAAERTVADGFAERVVETLESRGGEVVFVELTCDRETLRRRVEASDRRDFGKLASAALLDELLGDGTLYSLDVPPSSRRLSLDTTVLAPGAAAQRILRDLDV